MPNDPEFYGLLYGVQSKNILGHNYRGYGIVGEEDSSREVTVSTCHPTTFYVAQTVYPI